MSVPAVNVDHSGRRSSFAKQSHDDLVPRSHFGGSRTKKREEEGKGEEETRSGKIRIETSAVLLFQNARESATRVFTLYNLYV